MQLSSEDLRHWEHALGYLELGMLKHANAALDEVAPVNRVHPKVLLLRLEILLKAEKWSIAAEVARHLKTIGPDNSEWPIKEAYATRRAQCIEAAREILLEAEKRFPKEPLIKFNLGRYAAQTGNLEEARSYVKQAIELDRSFQKMAIEDPDLEPLWPVLKLSEK